MLEQERKKELYEFKKSTWLRRGVNRMQSHDLSEEIGILRVTLEGILEKITDSSQLLQFHQQIAHMTDKIERLVKTDLKNAEKLQTLVNRDQLISIAQKIVEVVFDFVDDPETMKEIATRVEKVVTERVE